LLLKWFERNAMTENRMRGCRLCLSDFNVLDAVWAVKCAVNDPLLHRRVFLQVGLDPGVGL
ncbi:MAG: hypothetical protein LV471_12415, partial [Nitrosomonas sp.]|nr:hypothetical protein [Nitrosomonas sp.]